MSEPAAGAPGKGPLRALWRGLAPAFEGVDAASLVLPVVASAVLLVSRYHGGLGAYHRLFGTALKGWPFAALYPHLYWFLASFVLYGLVTTGTVVALPGERLRDYGTGLGDWRLGLKVSAVFFAVMLPLVLVFAGTDAFRNTYPLDGDAVRGWSWFLVYEPFYWLYFVAWEWLFRGFLLFGLHKRMGNHAIWVQLIPFALMHSGKPELEAYGSIVAGIALAVLALRTRSFWWGAFLHIAVAGAMDIVSAFAKIK